MNLFRLAGLSFALLALIAATRPVAAHDYWLQPERFFLAPGESTAIRVYVGDHLQQESERPFQAAMTPKFQLIGAGGKVDLIPTATDDKRPAGTVTPPRAGSYLIAMERDWSYIEIEAEKFNDYLKHEGLDSILDLRKKMGEFADVGRERYRRYLKAQIQAGPESDETYAQRLGHRLEILPKSNPTHTKAGERLFVTILFDGKPLADVQVAALQRRGDKTHEVHAMTDAAGDVPFTLDQTGMWLIRLVHMRPCSDDAKVDWESFWASYAFEVK